MNEGQFIMMQVSRNKPNHHGVYRMKSYLKIECVI